MELSNYIQLDVLKYILDIYISHHPEDINNLNKFSSYKFKINLIKRCKYHQNMILKRDLIIDGYVMKSEAWSWRYGRKSKLYEYNKKYNSLHSRSFEWAGEEGAWHVIDYENGKEKKKYYGLLRSFRKSNRFGLSETTSPFIFGKMSG